MRQVPFGESQMTIARQRKRRAFTIVELLVVVAIIALLVGIALPALSSARRQARKATELSHLRMVGTAWTAYAAVSQEYALPGYLHNNVQNTVNIPNGWRVKYKYADGSDVPGNRAAPWTFRLAKFLDHNHEAILGYRDLETPDRLALGNDSIVDLAWNASDEVYNDDTERPETAAEQPSFGYNGYYVGGWWRMQSIPEEGNQPRPRYWNARRHYPENPPPGENRINVIARTPSALERTDTFILFCSTTGTETGVFRSFPDDRPGCYFAIPRFLGTSEKWRQLTDGGGTSYATTIESVGSSTPDASFISVPIGRYTGMAASLRADLHVEVSEPGVLDDMRHWIGAAEVPHQPVHE